MKIHFLMSTASAFIITLFVACESPVVVQSTWTDSEIVIGTDTLQWKDVMQYPDDPQFGIGARNDKTYLYLCVKSWNHEINRKILRSGFTTWFTSPSKKGKRFGIHFPLGAARNAAAAPRGADRESGSDVDEMKARMEEALADMELLGPGKDDSVPVKTRVAESFGVVVRVMPTEENLVYEIKVPLRQDTLCKYAIDIGNDSLLTIAFESTVRDADAGRGQGEGGGELPGMSGAGGGMRGGGGGRGMHDDGGGGEGGGHKRSFSEEMSEQFKASFSMKLAHKTAR
jgi:hypothetical protein